MLVTVDISPYTPETDILYEWVVAYYIQVALD